MASLPWFIHMIVGVLITAYSRIVMAKSNVYAMKLFFYLGIAFFAWGLYKLLRERLSQPTTHHSKTVASSIVPCKVCGTRNYRSSFFCHICGNKIDKNPVTRL